MSVKQYIQLYYCLLLVQQHNFVKRRNVELLAKEDHILLDSRPNLLFDKNETSLFPGTPQMIGYELFFHGVDFCFPTRRAFMNDDYPFYPPKATMLCPV